MKIFKFMVFRLLENEFACQKIESRHFYLCPPGRTHSKFLSSSPRQMEITHRPMQHSFGNLFLPNRKETMNTVIFVQKRLRGEEMKQILWNFNKNFLIDVESVEPGFILFYFDVKINVVATGH